MLIAVPEMWIWCLFHCKLTWMFYIFSSEQFLTFHKLNIIHHVVISEDEKTHPPPCEPIMSLHPSSGPPAPCLLSGVRTGAAWSGSCVEVWDADRLVPVFIFLFSGPLPALDGAPHRAAVGAVHRRCPLLPDGLLSGLDLPDQKVCLLRWEALPPDTIKYVGFMVVSLFVSPSWLVLHRC